MNMPLSSTLENFLNLNDAQRKSLIQEDFVNVHKSVVGNLNALFLTWTDCKELGLVDYADQILTSLIDLSIKEKRVWMLKKLNQLLGKRNSSERKKVESALSDFTQSGKPKKILHENFDILKIVERDLMYRGIFEQWIQGLDQEIGIDEYRIIYLGILLHGVSYKSGKALSRFITSTKNQKALGKLVSEFKIKAAKEDPRYSKQVEEEIVIDISHLENSEIQSDQKINVNLIDAVILEKYLNDVLFSLYCLKDFKSIYRIGERLDLKFSKKPKDFLAYNFYRVSALLEEKKFRQVQSIVKDEMLNYPLTTKEAMPFFYLLAESYIGLEKYEKALEILMTLQTDKVFHGKAKLRINEIKKN